MPLARLGATFAEMRSYTEAVAAYRQAKALAPQDQEIARGLGAVLLALGKPQLALAELTAALGQRRDEPHLLNLVGVAYDESGRHDLAQQAYADGLRAAPGDLPLRNNLGLSQALSGDFAAAEATLGDAVEGARGDAARAAEPGARLWAGRRYRQGRGGRARRSRRGFGEEQPRLLRAAARHG